MSDIIPLGGPQPAKKKEPMVFNEIPLGLTFSDDFKNSQILKDYFSQSKDANTTAAKLSTSAYMAKRLKLPTNYVLQNYDQISEAITGISNNPQHTFKYIANGFKANNIYIKKAKLWREYKNNPNSERRKYILQEIDNLNKEMPPVDMSKHNPIADMAKGAAGIIPYSWAVTKYTLPGIALGIATKGLAGKSQLAAGLSLAASLISTTGTAASFKESHDLAQGIIFGDLMQITDSKGNHINESIADTVTDVVSIPYAVIELISQRLLLTGSSALKNIFSKITKNALDKMLTRAAARTVNVLGLKGVHRTLANNIIRIGGNALKTAAFGMTEEELEELSQDSMQMIGNEFAKQITNELDDTDFVKIQPDQVKQTLAQTVKGTAQAVILLQIPHIFRAGRVAYAEHQSIINAKVSNEKLKEQTEEEKAYAESDDPNVIDFIDNMAEEELKVQQHDKVETDIKEDNATVKRGNGEVLGKVHFSRQGNNILIDKIENLPDAKVSEVVNDIRIKFPDKKVVFSAEGISQSTIGRLTEDENPEIAKQNISIDNAKYTIQSSENTIKNIQKDIEDLKSERETADDKRKGEIDKALEQRQGEIYDEQETIDLANEQIKRSVEAKAYLTQKPTKPLKNMTAEEYKTEYPNLIDTDIGKSLSKQIQDISAMDKNEADAAVELLDRIAKAKHKSPIKWLSETFGDKVVTKQKRGEERASVTIYDDLKAMIRLAKTSDFKSWVHEVGHILRSQLTGEELDTATKWAEKESGTKAENGVWTNPMEETFAEGFVKYLNENTISPKIDSIFKKIATYLKDIFENVLGIGELSDDIKRVYRNQILPLTENNGQKAVGSTELFEPKHKEAIKQAVENGEYVPDKVLEELPQEEWAAKEIEKRKETRSLMTDFPDLKNMAIEATDFNDFLDKSALYMGENVDQLNSKDEAWYKMFYDAAKAEGSAVDINTGNTQWKNNIDENYVKNLVEATSKDIYNADKLGLPASVVMAARRYLSKKEITPKRISVIEQTLKNNPAEYRSIASYVLGDMEEVRQVEIEREYSQKYGVEEELTTKRIVKEGKDLVESLSDAEVKKQIQTKQLSAKKAEKLMGKASEEIRVIRDKLAKTNKAIEDLKAEHDERLDAMITSRNRELKQETARLKEAVKKQKGIDRENTLRKIADLKDKYNNEINKQKALEKAVLKQKTQELNDRLKQQKAELRDKIKAKKEREKAKAYMKKLGDKITRDIPASVDATYRGVLLRLKGKVDPHFRQRAKVEERISLRKFYEENPEIAAVMPKDFINSLEAKPLNEWTIEELEKLNNKIDAIEKKGKDKLRERKFLKDVKDLDSIMKIRGQLYSKGTPGPEAFTKFEKKTFKEKLDSAVLQSIRPNRMVDMLDAGASTVGENYDGPIYRIIWDGITKAHNEEVLQKHRRTENIKAALKKYKIGRYDLHKQVEAFGKKWFKDEIIDIYASQGNEHKHGLITNNNKITQEMQDELMSHLTENEKGFAQAIMDDYAESYSRYAEAYYLDKNIILNQEENYTPIRVILEGMTEQEMDMRDEMLSRAKKYPSLRKSATNPRVEHGHPIKLGLYDTWVGAMAEEEHYINNAEIVRHLNRVLGDKEVMQAANEVGKGLVLSEVKKWIRRYVNPLENKSTRGWDRFTRATKRNAGIAYLFGTMTTVAKQLPSAAYFLYLAGPKMWSKYFLTPMGILEYKDTRAKMERLSPELAYERSLESYQKAILSNTKSISGDMRKMIGEYGLKPIEWMDRGVITIGWKSVFESKRSQGFSEEEAARKATQAVLLTQPAAGVKDTSAIYSDDHMLSVFTMFTNQLNQIYNMLSYDMPQALKRKQFQQFVELNMGVMFGAAVLWIISQRRMPKDKKDYAEMFSEQALSTLPIVGKTMASMIEGYDLSVPALAPFKGGASALGLGLNLIEGKQISHKHLINELWNIYEGGAVMTGTPFTFTKRAEKGIEKGKPLQYILAGGEINKEKSNGK